VNKFGQQAKNTIEDTPYFIWAFSLFLLVSLAATATADGWIAWLGAVDTLGSIILLLFAFVVRLLAIDHEEDDEDRSSEGVDVRPEPTDESPDTTL
jgi:hypothetical protein